MIDGDGPDRLSTHFSQITISTSANFPRIPFRQRVSLFTPQNHYFYTLTSVV